MSGSQPVAMANSIGKAKPELLSPAGNWDCVRAAVENGADAIYFGLHEHNARARAHNFDFAELDSMTAFMHRRGVRGYVTLNTLIFSDELPGVEAMIRRIANSGVDAIIVQDLAVAALAKAICPELGVHASTQMTLTSAESIRFVERLGVERVILARELSIREIRLIRQRTTMPLECFVHGALCVAYSGQCLTSEALGGRSANRGECAQACRLPYDLVCDGETQDMVSVQYLLSPQDLAAFAMVPELVELGMTSLKIEGRLKTPEYVANITRHYREAIDGAVAGRPVRFSPRDIEEMELSFSRGFFTGWMHGNDHKKLVHGRSSSKRGVRLGEVVGVRRDRVAVKLTASVKRGDGIAFDDGGVEKPQIGGRVFEIFGNGKPRTHAEKNETVELAFGRDLDISAIQAGNVIWKTDDPELTARLRKTFTSSAPLRRVPVDFKVTASAGEQLHIVAHARSGAKATVSSETPLQVAVKHSLTIELLREQLGRLGGTIFELGNVEAEIVGNPMVPLSVLGSLRKQILHQLDESPAADTHRECADDSFVDRWRKEISEDSAAVTHTNAVQLAVLCRNLKQLRDVVGHRPDRVYVDFQDIREYREAVPIARAASVPIYLATPRIQKPLEGPLFRHLLRQKADGVLVRNLAALDFYTRLNVPVVADFSLNAANEITTALLKRTGVERVTASYDLDGEQLLALTRRVPSDWLEVVIFQHMPMFHMEHCVFCAFLSPGTDRTNCGRPCDRHSVTLRDRQGMEHPLKADVGCRNTLFNAVAQSAAEHIGSLRSAGVGHFRIELLDQNNVEIAEIIAAHRELLNGRIDAKNVWSRLKATNQLGVTRGTFDADRRPKIGPTVL